MSSEGMNVGHYKRYGRARLLKLAEHLKHGKLGHKKFDFTKYNSIRDDKEDHFATNRCGTVGCAIGECPILFPRQWRFDLEYEPVLRGDSHTAESSGQYFFGISFEQYARMFIPTINSWTRDNGAVLPHTATKTQVANNIIKTVKMIDKELGL